MFDITSDDINQLNDTDLRELVGRLCEAELESRGYSTAAVTWGGNQTAADGGLDVRVELPPDKTIEGFIPRTSIGFQVKKPDMPRAAILSEMKPAGTIRPVIQALVNESGAYVIVSSTGSTADSALRHRRNALREALKGVPNAEHLYTDFYDRTRLATWVRSHPGLITWVKARVGRVLVGWQPYGMWSGAVEDIDAEYILDDKLRLHLGMNRESQGQSVADAIDELRDILVQPGKIVRLAGLSGVGKTRLAQALFDPRIGLRPLSRALAVYTNLSDNPEPQPTGLTSDLIANRMRAVLIVDNCPPKLHRRLSELCGGQNSTVSVLSIEYDVRDDQPENTQVVTLDTSSIELIERLTRRRYPHLSQVDAHTIAEASGGNARIAIALAETVEHSETIAGLSNDDLFQRLFHQRHEPDNALLLAAQACSLVYSFQGEAFDGMEAELPRLAALIGQDPMEINRHVVELFRRDLVQQRGVWRAVLPHAIANRLAARALQDIPYELIDQQLITDGTERLARSFSRRLSFLHDNPSAVAIVERWFAPGGFLSDVTTLNDLGRAMFENVAPVLPEATLVALERVGNHASDVASSVWQHHLTLLRSLAYDAHLFERSAKLLVFAATQTMREHDAKEASDTFVSLFTIFLSGTHATIEQRLGVIEQLLISAEPKVRTLGLMALDKVLEAMHFSSSYPYEFGARSRDYGYESRSNADVAQWYGSALAFIERFILIEGKLTSELRDLVVQNFRGLWISGQVCDELEKLFREFSTGGFWRDGWVACRETIYFEKELLSPDVIMRLTALEADLRPLNLQDKVRAVVLGDSSEGLDLDDLGVDSGTTSEFERYETTARELGALVAVDDNVFEELLPELLQDGNRSWAFGRGLASKSPDPSMTWEKLIERLDQNASEQADVQVLCGFLAEMAEQDRNLVEHLLDLVPEQHALLLHFPVLHAAIKLNERGVERLKRTLSEGDVPIWKYRNLAFGRACEDITGTRFKELLLMIADQPDGFDVALEILRMRLFSDSSEQRQHEPDVLETGRELLQRIRFGRNNRRNDHNLAEIVKSCLKEQDSGPSAAGIIAEQLRKSLTIRDIHIYDNDNLLRALLEVQPIPVLDSLFSGDEANRLVVIMQVFERISKHRINPTDIISNEVLITWCEAGREYRYPLAASIITYTNRSGGNSHIAWSEQAKVLFTNAPDPGHLLKIFIKRFRPRMWSGSLATLMEANASLLDNLESHTLIDLAPFVTEAKAKLAQEIEEVRQWETKRDRVRDERFEW